MDVPSTVAGKVQSLLVQVGDTVSEGSPVAIIDAVEGPAPAAVKTPAAAVRAATPTSSVAPAPAVKREPATLPPIDESGFSSAHAGPSVRKLARELGVNLAQIKGKGPKNRILHDDVKAFVKAVMTGGAAATGRRGAAGGSQSRFRQNLVRLTSSH